MNKNIVIKGAREHNLKNIDLTIPRDKLIVLQVFQVRANQALRLILFMPRVKEDM